ncbi:iron ABC transporter permease [Sediminispirochaeta smaragdinae]|uniref:Transport system permease protein n=1 Tax=Sediminispirochaeta smaragdinae (strain DSM 11293 / JCM 15392 / SEBR 4228) TaxID=573413 RepID=E1RCS1_SEDSS|nr:iron ABC transporter permease [Sediminispirochaeta smaragdinae]ADK80151.1 transport system permease protein [Sediminispirochaeta smaragdinae DSM 11293]
MNRILQWSGLLLLLLLLFLAGILFGSVNLPLSEVWKALYTSGGVPEQWRTIIVEFRLPRSLTALLAGAALSVSGLFMQTLFRNPLAGPSVLGINAGANLGVALVVLSSGIGGGAGLLTGLNGAGRWSLAIAAICGSLLVLLIILAASRRVASVTVLLLFGILFGYAANALVTLLIHFSAAEQIHSYITWSFGSFASTSWDHLAVMAPVLGLALLVSFMIAGPSDVMILGQVYAVTMGVPIIAVRGAMILCTALLAGTVGAFCGPVTFLGVAVPHLARGIFSASDHRTLIPASALSGASVALAADLIARLPGSNLSLPLNAVTSLFGAPVVMYVLLRERSGSGAL